MYGTAVCSHMHSNHKPLLLGLTVVVGLALVGGVYVAGPGTGGPDQTGPDAPPVESETPDEPAPLEIVDGSFPGWVHETETLAVAVRITNTGTTAGHQTVKLGIDADDDGALDRTVARQDVSVEAGQTTQLTFSVDAPAPGEYTYGVVTESASSVTWAVDVLEPPALSIGAVADEAVVEGETTEVSTTVTNEGGYGERSVRVSLDAPGVASPVTTESLSLSASASQQVTATLPTDGLAPGTYEYTVETDTDSMSGTVQVLRSAAYELAPVDTSVNVTRGTGATVIADVTNTGEVAGSKNVTFDGPGDTDIVRTVELTGGETKTVNFVVSTADLAAGTYAYSVSTPDDEVTASPDDSEGALSPLRVRDGEFRVTETSGNETVYLGDELFLNATVVNTGDATDTQTLELKIDIDDDDAPESYGLTTNVTLAPGEERTVRFRVPYMDDPDPFTQVEDLPVGAYIFEISSEDDEATGLFEAKTQPVSWHHVVRSGGGGSSDDPEDDDTTDTVSLDEISQQRYDRYYDELSGDTQSQLDEIYQRQPFTGDLGVTDVMTREEIAVYEYGLDWDLGRVFTLDVVDNETLQQQIEHDYDAQFTTESGDTVESWEELAQAQYGTAFADLTASQQADIKETYRSQFD